MDFRTCGVGVSHSDPVTGSSQSSNELVAEFSSSEEVGDGELRGGATTGLGLMTPFVSCLCFFFFFRFSGFPEELTRALVKIDRL